MKNIIYLLLLSTSLLLHPAYAQKSDSLWVKVINKKWDAVHYMKDGQTVFDLAQVYHAPPADIARENGISYNTRLNAGNPIYIPLDIYNRISKAGVAGTRPLYYKTTEGDDWQRMAFLAGTSAAELRTWNRLPMAALSPGQILLVGWIKYDAPQEGKTAPAPISQLPEDTIALPKDTVAALPRVSKEEEQFNLLTNNGEYATTEKGAAIYFDSKTPGSVHYAFFNLAPRGSVIKIINPGNGHYVFAKVIGTIPEQDRYQNALLGLSINAQKTLGGTGSRTWCEVQY